MKFITKQKYILATLLFGINIILSSLVSIYHSYWYIFIVILGESSFINSINVILLLCITLFIRIKKQIVSRIINNIVNYLHIYILNPLTITNIQPEIPTDLPKDLPTDLPTVLPTDLPTVLPTNSTNIKKFIYVLPCYNETEIELNNTINSILDQSKVKSYKKLLVVICDGKIKSESGNGLRTDKILTNVIFKEYIEESLYFDDAYKTWVYDIDNKNVENGENRENDENNKYNKFNSLEVHTGEIKGLKFLLIVKSVNLGKRDSLTLIRRLCHYYNNLVTNEEKDLQLNIYLHYFSYEFLIFIERSFCDNFIKSHYKIYSENNSLLSKQSHSFSSKDSPNETPKYLSFTTSSEFNEIPISYIIGTDADTILDTNCSYELLSSIIKEEDKENNKKLENINSKVIGIVGFVDIVKSWNPLVVYQYCEYLYAQCLKRRAQSLITNKVSCLSGCVQLIKICKETCGNKILDAFNRLPNEEENIFNHIRSYASEDRNHICIMFNIHPYVKTLQNIKAISYTNVPDTLMKFIRQRKRWCAGASCNDMLLVCNKQHNKWERIQSFINVLIFSLTIFVFVATINFIISIVTNPSIIMLQIATIMMLPALYSLSIPIVIYNDGITFRNKIFNIFYYFCGFIIYYVFGSILNLFVYVYTLYYLDDLNWNSIKINSIVDKNINIANAKCSVCKGFNFSIKYKQNLNCFKCFQKSKNKKNKTYNSKCIFTCGCKYIKDDEDYIANNKINENEYNYIEIDDIWDSSFSKINIEKIEKLEYIECSCNIDENTENTENNENNENTENTENNLSLNDKYNNYKKVIKEIKDKTIIKTITINDQDIQETNI